MSLWWALAVALCTVLSALLAAWSWLWSTRLRTNVPGPWTLPLLGNALYFWKTPVIVEHMRALQRRHGDVFRVYVGTKLIVVVTRPEDVQKVLAGSKQRDPYFIDPLRTFLGDGLITSHGSKWRTHRRAIEPAYGRETVCSFLNTFNHEAESLCKRLEKSTGSEMDVYRLLFYGTARSMFENSFGVSIVDLLSDSMTIDELIDTVIFGLNLSQKRTMKPWMHPEWTLYFNVDGLRARRMVKILHNMVKRGLEILSGKPLSEERGQKMILADVLFGRTGGQKFPSLDIYDESITLAVAGSETTASALSCTLCLLGLYPEWQERAVRELGDVYGSGADYLRPSTMEDLNQLVVLESILKETIRLFPTIPINPYHTSEDILLGCGRYRVPRHCCVIVAYNLLHRQPDAFPNPDNFDPGHFLEGNSAKMRHPCSYLPFGGGARKCVGARYAMVQMKTVLSALLRRFRFLPGSTREELEEVILSITGHPVTGYRVTCVPRDTPVCIQ